LHSLSFTKNRKGFVHVTPPCIYLYDVVNFHLAFIVIGDNGMNKDRLFDFLEKQDSSVLIELLENAYDKMNTNQRHEVFGGLKIETKPSDIASTLLYANKEQKSLLLSEIKNKNIRTQ